MSVRLFQSTPPRRWRLVKKWRSSAPANFNPLHREGGDVQRVGNSFFICGFQSTPPRRWRRGFFGIWVFLFNFNPLHREGGDPLSMTLRCSDSDFNPLHREGGDGIRPQDVISNIISIHSTAKVETKHAVFTCLFKFYFNPLHREGGDMRYIKRRQC